MKIFFVLFLFAVFLVGCSSSNNEPPQSHIGMDNFWNYLNITIVHTSQHHGTVLQIYSVDRDTFFHDVFVTYTIFERRESGQLNLTPQTRLMRLETNGRGTTQSCMQVYPRIINISGLVTFS